MKFYLFIISFINYLLYRNTKNLKLLFCILVYNIILAIVVGSRFNVAILFIVLFCLNYNSIIKIKNIIYTSIIFFFLLYLFPIIGAFRSQFNKYVGSEDCILKSDLSTNIIRLVKYNNINLNLNEGLFNQFDFTSVFQDKFIQQTFINKPLEIILSRLNYLDITLRTINYKFNNFIENNFIYYFDNIYALIPRVLYNEKRIITNNSDYLAAKLGVLVPPAHHAVGLRPIAEGFYYLSYYYLIIACFLGFLFFILEKFFKSTNILFKSAALYSSILLLIKRDSFHACYLD